MPTSRPSRLYLAVAVACLLLGFTSTATRASAADSNPRVVGIDIDCDEPIDREGILRLLPFDVGDELNPGALDEAVRLLVLRDVFADVAVDAAEAPGGLVVTVRLRRFPLVNLIRFSGNDALGDEELRRLSRLRAGSPLTPAARDYAAERMREAYAAEGFVGARVEPVTVSVAPGEVDIHFDIVEGEPLTIETLDVVGAPEEVRKDLVDEIDLEAGDRYAEGALREAEQAAVRILRQHRYYEVRVEPSWELQSGLHGRLVFEVEPGPLFEVEFHGNEEFSSEDLLETMNLEERPIITDGTWRELARRAVREYQEAGYHQAQVSLAAIETRSDPTPTKIVRFDVHEGTEFRVRQVDFEGNESISTARLRSAMQTRPPSWVPWVRGVLVDEVLADDLKRVLSVYRRRGFISAQVGRPNIDYDGDGIVVGITVEEGPKVVVRELQAIGVDVIAGRLPSFETKVGKPLDREKVDADRRALGVALAAAGYIDATVQADVKVRDDESDPAGASVELVADPGQQVRVGSIVVQNNFDTKAKVMLRELPVRSGDVLSPEQLLQGQGNIYKLGLFRSVTVRAADDGPETAERDVLVRVVEKPPGTFQWGLGYNTRDGFRGVGQVGYHNLQGLNRRIALRGQIDVDVGDARPSQYLADLSYREPHVLETRTVGSLTFIAQRSQRDIDNFKLERLAFIPGIERPLMERIIGGFALQIDDTRVFDLASDIASESDSAGNPCVREGGKFVGSCPFDDEGHFFSVSLDPFLVRNDLDDEFRPTSGTFESLRLRFAPSILGTQVPLVKIVGQHSHYVPIGKYLTFIYAVRVGWARALDGGDEQVPIQERLFLGGRTTVRGFAENSLGPETRCDESETEEDDCPHHPLGGDVSINLNGELQFPLLYGFKGAVFVDGGGVYLQTYNAKGEDFRESAGVGLRYMTPVGPLSLDYGFKLDRRDGESLGQIHFSVGRVF